MNILDDLNENDIYFENLLKRVENDEKGIEISLNQTLDEFIEFIENINIQKNSK